MIRVGIIGCGKIAQIRHIPEYLDNPEVSVAGYCDSNNQRAKEIAEQFGGKFYKDWQEMLADPAIDAVSVLTANNSHAEISVAALNAGKHVLCEKPMASTLPECEAMVEGSRRSGKILMIAQNQRFAQAHVEARRLLREGIIGKILTFKTSFGHSGADNWSIDGRGSWFFDKARSTFGAMGDLGIHKTDLIHFLTGQRVESVMAMIGVLEKTDASGSPIAVDDNAICIYHMSGGCVGTMTASWTYYGKEDNSTIIYGTKGIMSIYHDPLHSIVIDLTGDRRICYDLEPIQTNEKQTKSGVIDEFVSCIVEGRQPEISGEEAIHAMKAVFAAVQSSEKGILVKVD